MELRISGGAPGQCAAIPPCEDGRCKVCEAATIVAGRLPAIIDAMIVQATVAQSVEHSVEARGVVGSIPSGGIMVDEQASLASSRLHSNSDDNREGAVP